MTSRDLTENVEQLQVYRSLELIRTKAITVALRITERAAEYRQYGQIDSHKSIGKGYFMFF